MQIVSLGMQCYPAWLIKHMGYRQAAGPFDWLFSSPEMVADCLKNGFGRYLDPAKHKVLIPGQRSTHIGYRRPDGAPTWNHHDITHPKVLEDFTRRCERFMRIVQSAEPVLFVSLARPTMMTDEAFGRLRHILATVGANNHLLAIRREALAPQRETRLMKATQQARLYEFHPMTEMISGLSYADEADNLALADLVAATVGEKAGDVELPPAA